MVKAFAASAFAVTALFGAALVWGGCSGSSESTFAPEPPKADADNGPVNSFIPDGGGGPVDGKAEAGPTSCPPAIPSAFAPVWTAPTKKAACSPDDIKGYYDACVANVVKTESDGTCTKWKADHADCGACTEPDDQTGPVQWHLGRKYQTLNTAGCIAVAQGAPEAGKCGEAYNAAVQCGRQSCESCFTIGGTFSQFQDCQKSVQQVGICKTYETAQGTACIGYKNPDSGVSALPCFNNGTETQESHWSRVIGLLCGQ